MNSQKVFVFVLIASLISSITTAQTKVPVPVIFDTDIGPDYDDVGAITLLHHLADQGEAKILATIASNKYDKIARVLDVFNTYFKRPNIPIGVPRGNAANAPDSQGWSDAILKKYPHTVKSNNQVPDAVALYRKTLAAQADKSVTIVTVGFLTNLEGLLNSVPDTYSKLSGKELVKRKVKRLVSMAGGFPMGREYNVFTDVNAAKGAFNQWPTEIIFSGFEIGQKIKTGLPLVQNAAIKNSPVKDVYQISLPRTPEDNKGRMSWDQTAVLVAVRGANPYYNLVPGKIVLLDDGSNKWDNAKTGHFHLTERMNYLDVTRLIDKMMQHQPVKTVSKIKKAKP